MTSKWGFGWRKDDSSGSICDDYYLQYDKTGDSGECDLVIGLDFGTSASKVVIQAPDLQGSPSYAINFGKYSHTSMPYLLPTELWINKKDYTCTLRNCDDSTQVKDIKLDLLTSIRQ